VVERYHVSLVRIALRYVQDHSVAEEVAQDTWLTVLNGIDRFEARSSLKSWVFAILIDRAKTRGEREGRSVPISALVEGEEPEVPLDRFLPPDDPHQPLAWAIPPRAWPEERLLARETVRRVRDAIAELPPLQQAVLGLRDVEGWSIDEIAAALDVSAGNARLVAPSSLASEARARAVLRGMMQLRSIPPMTCRELVMLVTDYLEGTLPAADRQRFEAHLEECENCPVYVEQMRETIRPAGSLHEEDLSPQVRSELLSAFRDWKRNRS